jgi:hypothetical protein
VSAISIWDPREEHDLARIYKDLINLVFHPAASICETYPLLEETGAIDVLIPKKEPLLLGKW